MKISEGALASAVGIVFLTCLCTMMPNSKIALGVVGVCLGASLFRIRAALLDFHPSHVLALLLLATALPLAVAYLADQPLILLSDLRNYYHREEWIAEALLVVALQCITILTISLRPGLGSGVVSLVVHCRRRSWSLITLSVVGMAASSVLANQAGMILEGGYGGNSLSSDRGWFGGWPLVFVACSSAFFYLTGMSRRVDYVILYAIIAYWLAHGNRSEVLLQAVLPVVIAAFRIRASRHILSRSATTRISGLPKFKTALSVIGVGIILSALHGVGLIRTVGTLSGAKLVQESMIEARGVAVSTIGPSAYTLVAAVGLASESKEGFLYGASYWNYLYRTFPSRLVDLGERQRDLADVLISEAGAIGGAHFGAEAYLNGGVFGAVLFAALVAMLLDRLKSAAVSDGLAFVFLLSVVFYLPRFAWYGNIYMYKLILLFLGLFAARAMVRRLGRGPG